MHKLRMLTLLFVLSATAMGSQSEADRPQGWSSGAIVGADTSQWTSAERTDRVPYRIDIFRPPHDALDQLVQLGALDIEPVNDGLAAVIPDGVTPEAAASALGLARVDVSPAVGRDNGSVWLL